MAELDGELSRLRVRAEQKAPAPKPGEIDPLWPAEARRMLQELHVHQIELEMQNQELRETRQRLEISQARYFDLYDLAPVGYVTLSETGVILEANITAATLLGVGRAALPGRPLSRFILSDDQNIFYDLRNRLKNIQPQSCELRLKKRNSEPLWARLDVAVASNDADSLVWRVVITDITERKRVEEDAKAREELFASQKLESLGKLAGGIAHDFNNLLGGVLAEVDLALEDYRAGSSPEEELKHIRDAAVRGSDIVRQMMIYAGRKSETATLLDVSRIAGEMVELLRISISKRAVLETELAHDLPSVRAGAGQIRQVAMNLITNASEALEDRDGVIRLTTGRVNVDHAAATSKGIVEGDYVRLEVADTGPGMSLETQALVFDPFFTTKPAGHGLGLAVVQGIVRDLRGAIKLSSEPGKGATFQILFPCAETAALATGSLPRAEQPADLSPGATILFVDDEDALRLPLSKIFRKRGFTVLEAASGSSAIDALHANPGKIHVMLLDMTIPGPSSHEVACVALESCPGLKVVLTSAHDEQMARTTVAPPQGCTFIRKPFQAGDLLQTLRSVLA
jgi:PAS domain S-box-containing protein